MTFWRHAGKFKGHTADICADINNDSVSGYGKISIAGNIILEIPKYIQRKIDALSPQQEQSVQQQRTRYYPDETINTLWRRINTSWSVQGRPEYQRIGRSLPTAEH